MNLQNKHTTNYSPRFLAKGVYRHHIGSSSSTGKSRSWLQALKDAHNCTSFECFEDHDNCTKHAKLGAHVRISCCHEIGKIGIFGKCNSEFGTYVIPLCKQPTRGVNSVKVKSRCPAIIDKNAPVDVSAKISQTRLQVVRFLHSCTIM